MSKWSIPIEKLAAKAKLDIETVVRKVTLQVFSSVIQLSPVDTGRFRANWNVSYGVVDTSVKGADFVGPFDPGAGLREAQKALVLPVGGVVTIANSLPYAKRLEDGYSTQAPTGMVRKSAVLFRRYVREVTK